MTINITSIEDTIAGDLQVTQGDDITWQDTVADIETDQAIDITGATIVMTVKENIEDSTAVITKNTSDGIVIDSDQTTNKGKYKLSLVPSDTSSLNVGLYEYDIQITLSGKTQTISRGTLQILSDIT